MNMRKASIKETGEELTQEEWARFDAAVAAIRAEQIRVRGPADERSRRDRDESGEAYGAVLSRVP